MKKNRKAKHPVGTLCYYGPDRLTTTKIVAGVFLSADSEPILRQWVSSDCFSDRIQREVFEFLMGHGIRTLVHPDGNIGCPHEQGEGKDYPSGEDCPFCPYWKGRQ